MRKIKEHEKEILRASKLFDISPLYLKVIIYTERTLNYNWEDEALDEIIARSGLNSSLGFCQVKMKTAYWIEFQLSNSQNEFYPGDKYKGVLSLSKSPEEIISKLSNDSMNILYAAAYLRIFQSCWKKSGFPIDMAPDILGTLYSSGPYDSEGKLRKPNRNPRPNYFGSKVIEALKNLQ
ncbi:MAG: hypothetical protein HF312_05530 [Ignavibacteria bacterium]|nr:hypothetical protein [Ignavibacteria bacterium]MCU7519658.1 hypothetical protein [Ignavibacteria bacterium]